MLARLFVGVTLLGAAHGLALSASACAQAPPAYRAPLAPDGHPDLQGNWDTPGITPLERRPGLPLVVSAADAAKLMERMVAAATETYSDEERTVRPDIPALVRESGITPQSVRGEFRTSQVVEPPDGKIPYTAEGRAYRERTAPVFAPEFDDPEERWPGERCIGNSHGLGSSPFMNPPPGVGSFRQIIQIPADVVILTEAFADLRIIPVDGRTQLGQWGEKTRGRWEGDTLVVETFGFRPDDDARLTPGATFSITPDTRITERFTRVSDDEILYRFTVEDAVLFSQPWTGETSLRRTKSRLFEFACHEGNYSLTIMLQGSRAVERRAANTRAERKP
jgi:hypothetical protein